MLQRCAFSLVLFLAPTLCHAQSSPENLLSEKSQVYFRWDGSDAHRAAFNKTVTGKLMQGDLGKFMDNVYDQIKQGLGTVASQQGVLQGTPPAELKKLQDEINKVFDLPGVINKHGFVLAFEARGIFPPAGQVTLIVPDVGANGDKLFAGFRLLATTSDMELVTTKIGRRTVQTIKGTEPVQLGWWMEDKHAVVVVSLEAMPELIKRMESNKTKNITGSTLYKRVRSFKAYETSFRGYVDFKSLREMAVTSLAPAKAIVQGLGLDGLDAITYVSGFEDKAGRSTLEVHLGEKRAGLLKIIQGKSFKLSDVPPLPDDLTSWSMMSLDLGVAYDELFKAIETVVRVIEPNEADAVKEVVKQVNLALGIDVRTDLFGHLGDQIVSYASPGEGFFKLNQTYLIKVKDGDKVKGALQLAVKNLANATGVEMSTKKSTYRGVELCQVLVNQQGFFFVPTYAVHKDWLILSTYPQPVQGAIQRLNGELKTWKPDAELKSSLGKLPQEMTSISVVDPRPGVKEVLGVLPIGGAVLRSFYPELKFDVSSIPNGHAVAKELFPNATVSSEKDNVVRVESRSSLPLSVDLSGGTLLLVGYGLAAGFAFGF